MEDKEKYILDVSREHFMRYGYRKTCLDDIARDAKISKGTIYNYFKNKEDLFLRFVEVEFTGILEQIYALVKAEPDPERQLINYASGLIRVIRGFFSSHGTTLGIVRELQETYESLKMERHHELVFIEMFLKNGIQQGIFKDHDLSATASLISQILSQFIIRWMAMEEIQAEAEMRALFQLLFAGIRK
ncbi:TetR/AcrR family transcriptional regulator [Deltaproteobacteria bacterium TL4]